MIVSTNTQSWFGDFNLDVHHALEWKVGPMSFWVYRDGHEWRLRTDVGGDPLSPVAETELREEHQADVEDSKVQRFLLASESARLSLGVVLPDRPVVSKPASPVSIPAGESVKFYLSYPVWVTLSVGDPAKKLTEFPSQRLSDTWFGPNTREGMLCYATRSRCRLNLSDHAHVPNRAITPLIIRNRAKDTLILDKVKLPVATLSLYRSTSRNWLWTQPVTLLRHEDGDMAELQLGKGAPEDAGSCELISPPREAPQRNTLVRAFSQLF